MNPRQKAKDLVRLASDERTPEKERLVAAIRAVGLIQEHGLLDGPLDGIGDVLRGAQAQTAVKAASKLYGVFTDPDVLGVLKGISGTVKARASARERRRRR